MSVLKMFRLDGKIALVTGCRRGIGRGFSQALAEAGADIVGVSATLESTGSITGSASQEGKLDARDKPLTNAPHTLEDMGATNWEHPYSCELTYTGIELTHLPIWPRCAYD